MENITQTHLSLRAFVTAAMENHFGRSTVTFLKSKSSRIFFLNPDLRNFMQIPEYLILEKIVKMILYSLQTNDLPSVHRGIKLSCHFTLTEINSRWNALMYNPVISKLALQAIRNLHPEVVLQVQKKTLFSQAEIDLLSTIKSSAVNLLLLNIFEMF